MTLLELQRRMAEAVMLPLTRTDTMQQKTRGWPLDEGRSCRLHQAQRPAHLL